MKMIKVLSILLVLSLFLACEKPIAEESFSDKEFIDFLNGTSLSSSLKRIDSLANFDQYTKHKEGLLYYEKGRICGQLEKDVEAIGSLQRALSIFEAENDRDLIAKTSMLLGDSEAFISNNQKAFSYIDTALKIFREIDNKKGEAKALNSLGHIEFQNEDFDKSIAYVKQAADVQLRSNDKEELSASYNNIGYILEQSDDFLEAKTYYKKAIDINKEINRSNSSALRNLGYVHFLEGDFDKCSSLYLEALKIEEEAGRLSLQKEIYGVLLEVSIKDMSFKNSTLYLAKRDSVIELLITEENSEKIKLIEDQYSLIAKKKELIQAKKSNFKNKAIFAVLTGLFLFFGLFLRQKNKNSKLRYKQEKLILEQKVLRTQMNPHFIFNALTSIQKTIFDNDPIKSVTYLSKFAKLIRQNFDFTSKDEIYLAEDIDALKNYIDTQQMRFADKFNYSIELDDNIDPEIVKIPPMLLQPFVENAIEHGLKPKAEKGNLIIDISKKNNLFLFKISDDGAGLKEKNYASNKEHSIDIFKKRLALRNLGEEKMFSIESNANGTTASFYLDLN